MIKLKENLRLSLFFSLLLLLLTYAVEGWLYGAWINNFIQIENILFRYPEPIRWIILYSAATIGITLLVFIFTSPISLMTVGLNNWLRSDTRAFLSIFVSAFAFAILVQRVDYFARFLVSIAAVFLGRLDLQLLGYSRWLSSIILVIFCWFGFTGGILAFYRWNL